MSDAALGFTGQVLSPTHLWERMAEHDPEGEKYLEKRGLSRAVELGLVRFDAGSGYRVVVPMRGPKDPDAILTLQSRNILPTIPKNDRQRSLPGVKYPDGAAMGKVKEARTAKRVYLCEGLADTLALQIAGTVAIGAPGAGTLQHLSKFLGSKTTLRKREAVLCVQNDRESEEAFAKLAAELRRRGASVSYLRTSEEHGKDAADWLKAVGEQDFARAAEHNLSLPPEPAELEPERALAQESATSEEGRPELEDACEKIETAPKGQGGSTFDKQCFRIGGLVAGGEIEEEEAETRLKASGHKRGLPSREINSRFRRSFAAGREHPRKLAIRKLAAEYVFVKEQGRYFNTTTGGICRPEALDTNYRREVRASGVRKMRFTDLINPHMGRADDFGFYPGKGEIFEWKGKVLVNTWREPPLPPEKGPPPTPWLQLLAYLLPDKAEREHLLDVLAYNVQHPEGKVNHAIVLGGARGIGKDTLFRPLARWADRGWSKTSLEGLAGQFSSYQKGAKFIYVQEARQQSIRDAQALYNKLKDRISEDATGEVEVHEKYLNPYSIPNVAQWIVTTNYRDGVFFEDKYDRGHFVVWSPAEPKEPAYYVELGAYLDVHHLDVIGYLKRRDISAFNPKAPPPHTAAREEMYAATRSNAEAALANIVQEVAAGQAVFSMSEIKAKARMLEDSRPVMQLLEGNHPAQVGRVFRDARCQSDRIKIEEKRVTVYWRGSMDKREAAVWYRQHFKVWKAQSTGGGN